MSQGAISALSLHGSCVCVLKVHLHINIYRVFAYIYHNDDPRGGGGGVNHLKSNGYDRKILGGLKFSILGILCYENWASIVFGWLDLNRDFFGYSKQTEDSW